MRPEVVGDHAALPVLGQMPAAKNLQPAMLGAAGVEAPNQPLGAGGRHKHRTGEDVVNAFAVGAVGGERLPPAIKVMAPGVHKAVTQYIELEVFRAEPPNPSAIEPQDRKSVV